jgi:hypothetical protein
VLRLIGSPSIVNSYINSIEVSGFHLEDGEAGMARDLKAQDRNWFEPAAAVQSLRRISDNSPLRPEHTQTLRLDEKFLELLGPNQRRPARRHNRYA